MNKREEEMMFFTAFAEKMEICLDNCEQLKNDPPDFAFVAGGRSTSLEIRKYYKKGGDRTKQRRKMIDSFNQELNEISEGVSLEKFCVKYRFRLTKGLNRKRLDELKNELLEFVKQKMEENARTPDFHLRFTRNQLPQEIESLELIKSEVLSRTFWGNGMKLWWSGSASRQEVLDMVDEKSKKAERYRDRYNQNWLLLVVENEEYSDFSEYNFPPLDKEEKKTFDRVFILSLMEKEVTEV